MRRAVPCVGEACDNTTSVIGPPTSSNCVKLEDWAEGNYFFADKDKPGVGMPRGEILIGGPSVARVRVRARVRVGWARARVGWVSPNPNA